MPAFVPPHESNLSREQLVELTTLSLNWLRWFVRNEDAKDLAQDVMIELLQYHKDGVPFEGLKPLARKIARQKRDQFYRKQAIRKAEALPDEIAAGSDEIARLDLAHSIDAALATLPKPWRVALLGVARYKKTPSEMAKRLGCSVRCLKGMLAQARVRLKEALGEDFDESHQFLCSHAVSRI